MDTAEKTLKVLFKKSPNKDLVQNFDQLNDEFVYFYNSKTVCTLTVHISNFTSYSSVVRLIVIYLLLQFGHSDGEADL